MILHLTIESTRRIYERWMGKGRVVYYWQQEMAPKIILDKSTTTK